MSNHPKTGARAADNRALPIIVFSLATAIALGHWASERPVLSAVTNRLEEACPGITAYVSTADRELLESV